MRKPVSARVPITGATLIAIAVLLSGALLVCSPAAVPLSLRTYLDARGEAQIGFVREHYIEDPADVARAAWPVNLAALLK